MKRRKVLQLINDVLDARELRDDDPVRLSTVTVDFATRTVARDGRRVTLPDGVHAFTFLIVEGARVIIPPVPGDML